MLNPLNLISKFIKSPNQKELDRLGKTILKINEFEPKFKALDDGAFPGKTNEFKERVKKGENLDNLLIEVFACAREAAKRTINERPYDVQLIGGIVLTGGGSQLKHIKQLVEYITGMDTRVGYPNEHLSSNNNINVTSPLFSTGVGLVVKGFEQYDLLKARNGSINTRMHSKKNKGSFFEKIKTFFDDKVD